MISLEFNSFFYYNLKNVLKILKAVKTQEILLREKKEVKLETMKHNSI